MYKSLALAALLLPFSGYGVSKEARIKELKEAQYKKIMELQSLGKIILACDEYKNASLQKYFDLLRDAVVRKEEEQHCGSEELSTEDIEEMILEDNAIISSDLAAVLQGKKREFNHSVLKETYDLEDADGLYAFNSTKFIQISITLEQQIMLLVLEKYEICLQELLKTTQELTDLRK
jgi:hypothetical protein